MFGAIGKAIAGKKVTTYLKVNNQTSQQIRVKVPGGDDHDWYSPHMPNKNFRDVSISAGGSATKREDINSTASGNMVTMYIEFQNDKTASVRFDQGSVTTDKGHYSELKVVVGNVGRGVGSLGGAAIGGGGAGAAGSLAGGVVGEKILDAARFTPDERKSAQASSVRIVCHDIGDNTMEVLLTEV
jgi:hypothetical protein